MVSRINASLRQMLQQAEQTDPARDRFGQQTLDARSTGSGSREQVNEEGQTALILAIASCFSVAVDWLLTQPRAAGTVRHRDASGLAACDHAQLASGQTPMACMHVIDRCFLGNAILRDASCRQPHVCFFWRVVLRPRQLCEVKSRTAQPCRPRCSMPRGSG